MCISSSGLVRSKKKYCFNAARFSKRDLQKSLQRNWTEKYHTVASVMRDLRSVAVSCVFLLHCLGRSVTSRHFNEVLCCESCGRITIRLFLLSEKFPRFCFPNNFNFPYNFI